MIDCFLVIPCFHESGRVPHFLGELCTEVAASGYNVRIQLVDDGSGKHECSKLGKVAAEAKERYPFVEDVLALEKNRGKGGAIRFGWLSAPEEVRLLGFVDADGSVSAKETLRVMGEAIESGCSSLVMASRGADGAQVDRSVLRKVVARSFASLVRFSYGVQVLDTQCGCKFLGSGWFRKHEGEFVENGFGLDLELILLAKQSGYPMREVGIAWHEVAGSKVGIGSAWNLGKAVLFKRIGKGA
ncbi:glycosyltransferase [Pelagicoccus mobilis]|uniref:Glycosyltransferase n=1 Tax=Pelagicoccus mobilis TaxID=415221 RepID=A0A934S5B2_9BACT|nr:glycosyltransferase [Pelagicoccus mobilis]MBK1879228.1 glycosyltransferase [Pelagicoccus mobilis]